MFIIFYLGNKHIYSLTKGRKCQLRINLVNWNNIERYATYKKFWLGSESSGFKMHALSDSGRRYMIVY